MHKLFVFTVELSRNTLIFFCGLRKRQMTRTAKESAIVRQPDYVRARHS